MYFSAVLGAMARAEAVFRKVWVSIWGGRSDQNFCLLKVQASAGGLDGSGDVGKGVVYADDVL